MRVADLWQVTAGMVGLVGCSTHEWYLVPHNPAGVPTAAPRRARDLGGPASAEASLPAQRRSDGKRVWLKSSAIDWETSTRSNDTGLQVVARAYNPAVTAGSTLTWVGTAASLLGSGLFLAGRIRGDEALFLSGSLTALCAEPIMWAGIAYWLAGTMQPPYETGTPRSPKQPAAARSSGTAAESSGDAEQSERSR